jgi:hypothetical protein
MAIKVIERVTRSCHTTCAGRRGGQNHGVEGYKIAVTLRSIYRTSTLPSLLSSLNAIDIEIALSYARQLTNM